MIPISRRAVSACILTAFSWGCGAELSGPSGLECSIPLSAIEDGGALRDSLFALTNPPLERIGHPALTYLGPSDRVVGLLLDGRAVAVPHNILWWHEVVNLDLEGRRLAVTYSPLTGSSLVFDRAAVGVDTFVVSPFLFHSNLMMRDLGSGSLWPQLSLGARCGPSSGATLPIVPSLETTWSAWLAMHRASEAVSVATGFDRFYSLYPYGDYEDPQNREFEVPVGVFDERRPPKERVLAVRSEAGGIAFPFGELDVAAVVGPGGVGGWTAVNVTLDGQPVVVFWDRFRRTAAAFRAEAAGQELDFLATPDGIFDRRTTTRWRVDGLGLAGPLAGERLPPVSEAHVVFWFAWSLFAPDTELWTAGS